MISDEEDYDDPIKILDFEDFNDGKYVDPGSNQIHHDLKYKLSLKSCYMLPLSFFDIPSNLDKMKECLPLRVKLVDYYKHPWYFKKQQAAKKPISDNNSDIIDLTLDTENMHNNYNLALEKRREMLNNKLNIEIIKALGQKNPRNIDVKKNKGLIGLTITRRVIVSDIKTDDVCNENSVKQTTGKDNKNKVSVSDLSKIVKTEERVDIADTHKKHVRLAKHGQVKHETMDNHKKKHTGLASTSKISKVDKEYDTKCSLKNVAVELLNKILSLKKARAMKANERHEKKEKLLSECHTTTNDSQLQKSGQYSISMNKSNIDDSATGVVFSKKIKPKPEIQRTNANLTSKTKDLSGICANVHSSSVTLPRAPKSHQEIITNSNLSYTNKINKSSDLQETNTYSKNISQRSLTQKSMFHQQASRDDLSFAKATSNSSQRNENKEKSRPLADTMNNFSADVRCNGAGSKNVNILSMSSTLTQKSKLTHKKKANAELDFVNKNMNTGRLSENISQNEMYRSISHHKNKISKNVYDTQRKKMQQENNSNSSLHFDNVTNNNTHHKNPSSGNLLLYQKTMPVLEARSVPDNTDNSMALPISQNSIKSHEKTLNGDVHSVYKTINLTDSPEITASGNTSLHQKPMQIENISINNSNKKDKIYHETKDKEVSDKITIDAPEISSPERKSPILPCTILPKKTIKLYKQIAFINSTSDGRFENNSSQSQVCHAHVNKSIRPVVENVLNGDCNKNNNDLSRSGGTGTAAFEHSTEHVNNTKKERPLTQKPVQRTPLINADGSSTTSPLIKYHNVMISTNPSNRIMNQSNNSGKNSYTRQMYPNTHFGNSYAQNIPVINTQASQKPPQAHTYPVVNFAHFTQYRGSTNPILKNMLSSDVQPPCQLQYFPENLNVYQNMYAHHQNLYNAHPHRPAIIAPNVSNVERFWNYETGFNQPYPGREVGPAANNSIIGRNTVGVIKKINIPQPANSNNTNVVKCSTWKPPSACKKRDNSVDNQKCVDVEKPVVSKDEMLKELDKTIVEISNRKNLKRPYCTDNAYASLRSLYASSCGSEPNEKQSKPNTKSSNKTQREAKTVKTLGKGYSPPILPIPTYQHFLSSIHYDVKNDITNRGFNDKLESYKDKNERLINKINILTEERTTSMKKISIDDYKKRVNSVENDVLMLKKEICDAILHEGQRDVKNGENNEGVRKEINDKSLSTESSSKNTIKKDVLLDLGYFSDTPVKRTST